MLLKKANNLLRSDSPERAFALFREAGEESLAFRNELHFLRSEVKQQLFAAAAARCSRLSIHCAAAETASPRFSESKNANKASVRSAASLPLSVKLYMSAFFESLAEVFALHFALCRQAGVAFEEGEKENSFVGNGLGARCGVYPKAQMEAPCVFRASALLWTRVFATKEAEEKGETQRFRESGDSSWATCVWWQDCQRRLAERGPHSARALVAQLGLRVSSEANAGLPGKEELRLEVPGMPCALGVRQSLVLRLLGESALALSDWKVSSTSVRPSLRKFAAPLMHLAVSPFRVSTQTAEEAGRRLETLALMGREAEERSRFLLHSRVARAAAAAKATALLSSAPCLECYLCSAKTPLAFGPPTPLGLAFACRCCGAPFTLEFANFQLVSAAPVLAGDADCEDSSNAPPSPSSSATPDETQSSFEKARSSEEDLRALLQKQVARRRKRKEGGLGNDEVFAALLEASCLRKSLVAFFVPQCLLRRQPVGSLIPLQRSSSPSPLREGGEKRVYLKLFGSRDSQGRTLSVHSGVRACTFCSTIFVGPFGYGRLLPKDACLVCGCSEASHSK